MRSIILVIVAGLCVSGCAPYSSFQPETMEVGGNKLTVKGWTENMSFCTRVHLRPANRTTSLESLHLVTPSGRRIAPSRWEDKTSRAPRVSMGFGVGLPLGRSDHGVEGERSGVSPTVGTGVAVPLTSGRDHGITDVQACWKLTSESTPVTNCTLEVNVRSVNIQQVRVTPVLLAMTHPSVPQDGEPSVREVDFACVAPTGRLPKWLAAAPTDGTSSVVVRSREEAVGVLVPSDISQGDKVSCTALPMPVDGRTLDVADGLRLRDPAGVEHRLPTTEPITFVAPAIMTWALIDRDGKVVGSEEVPVSQVQDPAGAKAADEPILVQSDHPFNLPGRFDGDSSNTAVRVGGCPATVLTESPNQAVVVPGDMGTQAGKVVIEVTDAGQTFTREATAVHTSFDYPEVQPDQWARAGLIIRGLEPKPQAVLGVMVANCTPNMVKLKGKSNRQHFLVDSKDISEDGTYQLDVPVLGVATGVYVLAASISWLQKPQCPSLVCSPCGGIWFCTDTGKVNCGGARTCTCGGGAGHRKFGGPCGFHFCKCTFGRCQC